MILLQGFLTIKLARLKLERLNLQIRKPIKMAATVALRKKGKIAMSQRLDTEHFSGYWQFPGGRRDAGETLWQTALRELKEESGLDIPSTRLEYVADILEDPSCELCALYQVRLFDKEEPVTPDNETKRVGPWTWFTPEEALKLNLMPGLEKYIKNNLI
jgi:8-oxo-dGTP pyrophosphatase MutT (NUDIX family)